MLCHRYNIRRIKLSEPQQDLIPKWSDSLTEDEVLNQLQQFRQAENYFVYYVEPYPLGNISNKEMQVLFLEQCLSMKGEK